MLSFPHQLMRLFRQSGLKAASIRHVTLERDSLYILSRIVSLKCPISGVHSTSSTIVWELLHVDSAGVARRHFWSCASSESDLEADDDKTIVDVAIAEPVDSVGLVPTRGGYNIVTLISCPLLYEDSVIIPCPPSILSYYRIPAFRTPKDIDHAFSSILKDTAGGTYESNLPFPAPPSSQSLEKHARLWTETSFKWVQDIIHIFQGVGAIKVGQALTAETMMSVVSKKSDEQMSSVGGEARGRKLLLTAEVHEVRELFQRYKPQGAVVNIKSKNKPVNVKQWAAASVFAIRPW